MNSAILFFLTASFTTDQLNNISSPSLRHKELQQSADLHIVKLSIVKRLHCKFLR